MFIQILSLNPICNQIYSIVYKKFRQPCSKDISNKDNNCIKLSKSIIKEYKKKIKNYKNSSNTEISSLNSIQKKQFNNRLKEIILKMAPIRVKNIQLFVKAILKIIRNLKIHRKTAITKKVRAIIKIYNILNKII